LCSLMFLSLAPPSRPRTTNGSKLAASCDQICPCAIGLELHIMGYMSGRAIALLGAVGAAVIGFYIKSRRTRRVPSNLLGPQSRVPIGDPGRIDIDDDAVAEIIMRARPELERARELYAY
jgi:hypothetical protein